jgi:hypothetical protein
MISRSVYYVYSIQECSGYNVKLVFYKIQMLYKLPMEMNPVT